MKHLKRLGTAIALTLVIGFSAFADDPIPPCDPGETHAPPCSTAQLTSDDPTPGQTSTPPASSAVAEYVVAGAAIDFVESVLSLF